MDTSLYRSLSILIKVANHPICGYMVGEVAILARNDDAFAYLT